MSSNVTVYVAQDGPGDCYRWDGPHDFGVLSRHATDIIIGEGSTGEQVHEDLSPDEHEMLVPRGHFWDEELVALDPEVLRRTLLKLYGVYSGLIFHECQGLKDHDEFRYFHKFQRELAGCVLMCDCAIEQGRKVYLALH